jgi:hypothetical protein
MWRALDTMFDPVSRAGYPVIVWKKYNAIIIIIIIIRLFIKNVREETEEGIKKKYLLIIVVQNWALNNKYYRIKSLTM